MKIIKDSKGLKTYKWSIIVIGMMILLAIYDLNLGKKAFNLSLSNFANMLSVLPPIMVLIGLLDVWVPKEVMIKYMGHKSGLSGILIALILGSLAAGPLYAAFPIAAILLKKHAKVSNVIFFLGVWSTAKLPLVMFEYASFGGTFTLTHIISNLIVFWLGAVMVEKMLSPKSLEDIYLSSAKMIQEKAS